mmetsp:Transcript_20390/g.49326  ORF Transcript_20390/g.49326 Transcript_20390/m.49326 type:complete len:724 (-) Transcript_20390:11-2182(-)
MKPAGLYPDEANLVLSTVSPPLEQRRGGDAPPSARLVYGGQPPQLAEPIQGQDIAQDQELTSFHENTAQAEMTRRLLGAPPTAVQISFLNLKMQVPSGAGGVCKGNKEYQTILKEVSGYFPAGKFTAIMGASGAGKTTLLNAVAGEAAGGQLSGQVLVNGGSVDSTTMRKLRAFVFQDDVMLGTMTVREVINMSARLRLPPEMPIEEKLQRVDQVIEILHLERCAETIMGYAGERGGISGGERKRTGIAIELITNPSVVFLDEPTSGLDTYTAHSVCSTLKQLALAGRTVVATIHQPSSDIFHMFDNLTILAHGSILYQGEARASLAYFAEKGLPCPEDVNPADHIFMRILNDQDAETVEQRQAAAVRVENLLKDYKSSSRYQEVEVQARVKGVQMQGQALGGSASVATQMSVLCKRAFSNMLRNKLLLRAKLGQSIFMALLVGLIFRDLKLTQQSIQDRTGAMFFVSVNVTFSATFGVLSAFGNERTVFERERSVGMYTTLAYFCSKILVELPMNIIFPFIQGTIAYWLIGFQPFVGKWLVWCINFVLLNNVGTAFGITIACTFKSLEVTLAVAPLFILPLMLFSGFFVSSTGIPVYFDWIKHISPMKYSFAAFMINEYSDLELHCGDDEWVAQANCPRVMVNGAPAMADGKPVFEKCFCPVTDGEQVLDMMGFTNDEWDMKMWDNTGMLVVLYFGFLTLSFILLHRLVSSREAERAKLLKS